MISLINQRFPDDAAEVLDIALAVARKETRDTGFHPIAGGKKQVIITEDVYGDDGIIYLCITNIKN